MNLKSFGFGLLMAFQATAGLAATVSLPSSGACPGADIVVPIVVDPADGIIGMDLDIAYDPAVLTPAAVFATPFGSSFVGISNIAVPGQVQIALFGASPISGAGEVVCIVFHAVGPAGSSTPLTWLQHDLNEGDIPSTATDGLITIDPGATALSMPDDATGTPGSTVRIPISGAPADGYIGVDLVVRWNPAVLQAVDVTVPPGMPPDWAAIFNLISPGEALIALFGTTPLAGTRPLVDLRCLVVGDPGEQTPLDIVRGDVNEGTVPSCLDDGLFTVCPDCDDGNPCTDDLCDTASGSCVHTPNNANECSDGNSCTRDLCNGGQCVSTPIECNDNNPCTDDACDPASGCYYTPNADVCSDGDACTAGDHCLDGACVGTPVTCDDTNSCTNDSCIPETGCVYTPSDTNTCTDNSACTTDACVSGQCISTAISCNDNNPCTIDTCSPTAGCAHAPAPNGTSCSDGSACTTADACQAGLCIGGPLLNCNDGNTCTDDTCDPAIGCVNVCNNTCSLNNHGYGFYKRLCRGPHPSGEFLSMHDVDCVNNTCTFASVASVADICDRLTPNPPSDKCEHAEAQFMTLMLNVCRCRINHYQPIDASCGPAGSVGQAIADADAKLCNPSRTRDQCILSHCGLDEINSGKALWANSLQIQRVSATSVRLLWSPTYAGLGASGPKSFRVWRRQISESAFVLLAETRDTQYVDATASGSQWQYEVTGVY